MFNQTSSLTRRSFCVSTAAVAAGALCPGSSQDLFAKKTDRFQLKYILGSSMYGYLKLEEILPEVKKTGSAAIDIWPKPHGDQREQIEAMGAERFQELLKKNDVTLGCMTHYMLGPFGLQKEMKFAQKFGCQTMVTGGKGPKDLKGKELKAAVGKFLEQMKPHLAVAEETGVTIAVENHANNLIDSPDSLKWLAELRPSKNLGIAFAPYHLPQDEKLLCNLIETLDDSISVFYGWQHGMGCMKKLPKEQELLQMPGRGSLNFEPILGSLKKINYNGWTEIFMHPVPRGIPILETSTAVTAEINHSRKYLDELL